MRNHINRQIMLLMVIVGFATSGCALRPVDVNLRPEPSIHDREWKPRSSVSVLVRDQRNRSLLGYRSPAGGHGEINTNQPLDNIIEMSVENAFAKNGTTIIENNTKSDREITLILRNFEYRSTSGMTTVTSYVTVAFKVIVKNGDRVLFDEFYREDYNKEFVMIGPENLVIAELLNTSLQNTLDKILNSESFQSVF